MVPAVATGAVYVFAFAPFIGAPPLLLFAVLLYHWYERFVPFAATVSTGAVPFKQTVVAAAGWAVIEAPITVFIVTGVALLTIALQYPVAIT